jgi:hypothetical protein
LKIKILLIVVAVAAFLGLLLYSTLPGQMVRVEVCVSYDGKRECRTARGTTQKEASATAQTNACATLARGMTESMACQSKQPDSVRLLD